MYGRGTYAEYLADDLAQKQAEGWTEDEIANGKTNYVNGVEAPDNQKTLSILNVLQNPDETDDYIWDGGDELTEVEYLALVESWGYSE